MKKQYIGRIRLSKEDSEEWYGKPPFMYVTNDKENIDRSNINKAAFFDDKNVCKAALKKNFKAYRHLPSSKMEIMTITIKVDNIEEI